MPEVKLSENNTTVAITEADSKLFLGKNGEWWDGWLIASLVFAAVAAGAVFIFTTGSINAHKREAEEADRKVEELRKSTAELDRHTAELKADA